MTQASSRECWASAPTSPRASTPNNSEANTRPPWNQSCSTSSIRSWRCRLRSSLCGRGSCSCLWWASSTRRERCSSCRASLTASAPATPWSSSWEAVLTSQDVHGISHARRITAKLPPGASDRRSLAPGQKLGRGVGQSRQYSAEPGHSHQRSAHDCRPCNGLVADRATGREYVRLGGHGLQLGNPDQEEGLKQSLMAVHGVSPARMGSTCSPRRGWEQTTSARNVWSEPAHSRSHATVWRTVPHRNPCGPQAYGFRATVEGSSPTVPSLPPVRIGDPRLWNSRRQRLSWTRSGSDQEARDAQDSRPIGY
jgi:hypothetical protein